MPQTVTCEYNMFVVLITFKIRTESNIVKGLLTYKTVAVKFKFVLVVNKIFFSISFSCFSPYMFTAIKTPLEVEMIIYKSGNQN